MKTCSKCGVEKPLSDFHPHTGCKDSVRPDCKDCVNAANRARRAANVEQRREGDRRRYAENPTRQEAQKAAAKAFYHADRDRQRELHRAYYRAHAADWKNYRARRKARKRVAHLPYGRHAIYERDEGRCTICGAEIAYEPGAFHLDHIVPLARGGTDTPENLQLTCPSCNWAKWTT
jgi:5-methylcytosine-specific restriction endonuclease McrA